MDKAKLTAGPEEVKLSARKPTEQAEREGGYGAYGLELIGVSSTDLLVPVPRDGSWPALRVQVGRGADGDASPDWADESHAEMALLDGERVLLDRHARSASFLVGSGQDDGRFIHPLLTAAGTVFAWWDGHDAFHAGAFVTPEGAWGLVGEIGAGKSTLLAGLAQAGQAVLTDDLLVIKGQLAFAGPRCVDLREDATRAIGVEGMTRLVRGSERHRLPLGQVEPEVPLCGWIVLAWGRKLDLRPLSATERLETLARQRNLQGAHSDRLLQLARLPAWELRRPSDWDSFEPAVHKVLESALR